jgi:nitroreductase
MPERMTVPRSQDPTDDLFQAIYSQRAIRRFKPDAVPDDVLLRLVEAATKAPSGSNTQPWAFLVVRHAGKRAAIAELLRTAVQQSERFQRIFENVDAIEDPSQRRMLQGARRLFLELDHAPVLIIPCLHQVESPAPQGLLAGSSIYGAVQNLQLAARGLGLGTVLTTFQQLFEPQLRELLSLPEEATPVALIPLGYPDGWFGPTRRKPVEEVVHWDGWGG